jgi:NADH-quinone oxidoreductase subunit J
MTPELILFFALAIVAVIAALGMLLSRKAVHAALFLVLNFAAVAVLFLILGAPFIALAQVSVYAGAIMVLFLFVIMLLGAELAPSLRMRFQEPQAWAFLLALLLLATLGYAFLGRGASNVPAAFGNAPTLARDFGSPQSIGGELFANYLLPFELTSILLVTAMVGAVILTRDEKKSEARSSSAETQNPKSEI